MQPVSWLVVAASENRIAPLASEAFRGGVVHLNLVNQLRDEER
jgi:hypothetical protein